MSVQIIGDTDSWGPDEECLQSRSFWTLSGSPSLLAHPTFLAIAEANSLTPEQTLYKLAQLHGITPLSGTTSVEHMKQDLDVETTELKEDGVAEALKEVRKLIA